MIDSYINTQHIFLLSLEFEDGLSCVVEPCGETGRKYQAQIM